MRRKFKQNLSTIPPISSLNKLNNYTSHIRSLNGKKKKKKKKKKKNNTKTPKKKQQKTTKNIQDIYR